MAYRPFFPGPLVPVSGSVYASVPRRWFYPVFHGARPVPSTTGVGYFFSRVPVPPGLGPCTGPCTRRWLVGGFGLFSMARLQFRPRRASGTFFPCPRTARSGSVYGSVYASVPRRWFCPVFHGARPVPSTTGVGHFFSRVHVPPVLGPCTRRWLVGGFGLFSMARIQFRPRRASGIFLPGRTLSLFCLCLLLQCSIGSTKVLPSLFFVMTLHA